MQGFSIIICTHNPDLRILARLFKAILSFAVDSPKHEVIIIDNNSETALAEIKIIKQFLESKDDTYILRETTPGLTAARIRGIKAAKYDWLIFFDDDNEPQADYLLTAEKSINIYPKVGVWGPGNVTVEYDKYVDDWLYQKKELFQERHEVRTRFDNQSHWQDSYPYGTGLVVRVQIAFEYANRVKEGRYTLTDRNGKSLSSGGDCQIVLTGINMGFYAGVLNNLSLNHLINQEKANLKYLMRQQYGTASALIKAYNQVFFDSPIIVRRINNCDVLKRIYSIYRIYRNSLSKNDFSLLLASKMGEMNAVVTATGQKKPAVLRLYEQIIHA